MRRNRSEQHSTLWIVLIVLAVMWITALTACAGTVPTATTDSVPCQALKEISFSAAGDTEQTIREVREFNAVYRELCP